MMRNELRHSFPARVGVGGALARYGILVTCAALVAVTVPAVAQYDAGWGDEQYEGRQANNPGSDQSTLRGIVDWNEPLPAFAGPRMQDQTFVRIHLRDGSAVIVDFGPNSDVTALDLNPGNRFEVTGYRERISGEPVLVAERLRVNGRMKDITPTSEWGEGNEWSGAGYQQPMLQGTVDVVEQLRGFGGPRMEDQTIARLHMRDGTVAVVDFGRNADLSDLGIERGSRIEVSGYRERINREPILVAERLRVDGRMENIMPANIEPEYGYGTEPSSGAQAGWWLETGENTTILSKIDGFQRLQGFGGPGMENQTIVRLFMANGRSVIVDFGPNHDLRGLGIDRGNLVEVTGHREFVDGHPILIAERLQVEEQNVPIIPPDQWSRYGVGGREDQGEHGYRGDYQRASQGGDQGRQSSSFRPERQTTLQGTVNRVEKLQGFGGPLMEKDTLAEIDMRNGEVAIVDFGPNTSLGDLGVDRGSQVDIIGYAQQIHGQPVLMAERVQVNGEGRTITPASKWGGYGDSPASSSEPTYGGRGIGQTNFRGTIESVESVTLSGERSKDTAARLELEDGRTMIVDFGRGFDLSKLSKTGGDQIDVTGESEKLNGEEILVARQVRVDYELEQESQPAD